MSKGLIPALPERYVDWQAQLKGDIAKARQRAVQAVNAKLVQLYHRIGGEIRQRQEVQGWGSQVIDRLARDLTDSFPDVRGFPAVTSSTWPFSPSTARTDKSGSSLLPNCPGSML